MRFVCFALNGIYGTVVQVEVDIRRGIPGIDIVGLPDGAVREARDRIRVAIRNAGFEFPRRRILVNLAPGDVRKEGSLFDLPISMAILFEEMGERVGGIDAYGIDDCGDATGSSPEEFGEQVMILGELELSGGVRAVRGVFAAVAGGIEAGIRHFIVPLENAAEARALENGSIYGVADLYEAVSVVRALEAGRIPIRNRRIASAGGCNSGCSLESIPGRRSREALRVEGGFHNNTHDDGSEVGDFADMRGVPRLKRVMMVAAAGAHHTFLFGPPGSGKTMAAQRFVSILPDLSPEQSIAVTKIHSVAGILTGANGLIHRPPVREPHHTASLEGLIGGGRNVFPGEVSLAHHGVLLLDESAEFRPSLLQALREPLETGTVRITRAGAREVMPARFILVMTANPCPCGNLGREDGVCLCTRREIQTYWKKLGGPLLDRIDIRAPITPPGAAVIRAESDLSSGDMRSAVQESLERQRKRFRDTPIDTNGRITSSMQRTVCPLAAEVEDVLLTASSSLSLSARAYHSVIRIARTVADLNGNESIQKADLEEAIELRRFGDGDTFWAYA